MLIQRYLDGDITIEQFAQDFDQSLIEAPDSVRQSTLGHVFIEIQRRIALSKEDAAGEAVITTRFFWKWVSDQLKY